VLWLGSEAPARYSAPSRCARVPFGYDLQRDERGNHRRLFERKLVAGQVLQDVQKLHNVHDLGRNHGAADDLLDRQFTREILTVTARDPLTHTARPRRPCTRRHREWATTMTITSGMIVIGGHRRTVRGRSSSR